LNWKKISRTGKALKISRSLGLETESPEINFLITSSDDNISDFD
jgi:hypothetical protein